MEVDSERLNEAIEKVEKLKSENLALQKKLNETHETDGSNAATNDANSNVIAKLEKKQDEMLKKHEIDIEILKGKRPPKFGEHGWSDKSNAET